MYRALFCIILALGEVCERKCSRERLYRDTSVPAEVQKGESAIDTLAELRNSSTNSARNSYHDSNRDGSAAGDAFDENIENIPYNRNENQHSRETIISTSLYRQATRIMGLYLDGNELIHAQAALLAGIYKGLIGRPLESTNCTSQVCGYCLY